MTEKKSTPDSKEEWVIVKVTDPVLSGGLQKH